MWRRTLWFFILATFAFRLSAHPSLQFADDPEVRAMFAEVLVHGGSGELQTESAAFVVRSDEQSHRCFAWPETGIPRRQTFIGELPEGVWAIVHTHPRALYRPSPGDFATARITGVPVLVLTPMHIWAATPDGRSVPLVRQRFWVPAERRKCEPAPAALTLQNIPWPGLPRP